MDNDAIRTAFEADYFGDLPATVPARQQGAHGTYNHAAPQHAWTIWQRAWAAALASAARPTSTPEHYRADVHTSECHDGMCAGCAAPTTQAAPARWYVVNKIGMATLCADEADARNEASENTQAFPGLAPYRAVQLVEVAAARAAKE